MTTAITNQLKDRIEKANADTMDWVLSWGFKVPDNTSISRRLMRYVAGDPVLCDAVILGLLYIEKGEDGNLPTLKESRRRKGRD